MNDTHNPSRDVTEQFIGKVATWVAESGEVLIVLRYLRAAGKKHYALCRSEQDFRRIIDLVPIGTDIIAFRQKHLPFRGIATPSFIDRVIVGIPDGTEYLVVRINGGKRDDPRRCGEMGDMHRDLREELEQEDVFNTEVAVGPLPPFNDPDNNNMVSASKGGVDGPR